MSTRDPIPLSPKRVFAGEPDFEAILRWPFAEQPFYQGQVIRLLQNEIPQRIQFGSGRLWVYHDPDGNMVGFGTLDECNEYERFTEGKLHSYIPLLAVNPMFQNRGHGQSIIHDLIHQARLTANHGYLRNLLVATEAEHRAFIQSAANLAEYVFLDVYTANLSAISLYKKCGFVALNEDAPICDPQENNEPYIIMAIKIPLA